MARSIKNSMLGSLIALAQLSCGSWTGNPPSSKVETGTTAPVEKQGTVELVIQGSGTSLRVLQNTLTVIDKNGEENGQIILTSIQLNLSSITIRSDASDSVQRPVLTGPFTMDLLTNTITPAVGRLTLPPGLYQDLRMNLYKPNGGSSLTVTGTYIAPNQASSYVKIALDAQDEISFLKDVQLQGIPVTAGANTQIAVRFLVDRWFNFKGKGTDLSGLAGKDITIDASTAGTDQILRQAILSNVKAATDFDKYLSPSDDKDDASEGRGDKDGRGRP